MVDRPERTCVPIEMEMLPLYREPPGAARLRRRQLREQRARNRASHRSRLAGWLRRPRAYE